MLCKDPNKRIRIQDMRLHAFMREYYYENLKNQVEDEFSLITDLSSDEEDRYEERKSPLKLNNMNATKILPVLRHQTTHTTAANFIKQLSLKKKVSLKNKKNDEPFDLEKLMTSLGV